MDAQLLVAVLLAIGFAVTNGLHDASNAIATLVATRAATPLQAILLASVFNLLGPLFLGAAVADTIGGIVTVPPDVTVEVIGAGLAAAVTWNLVTWRLGLPSSSGHALVGGLVGAAVVEGGVHAINWGGIEHWRPVGVFGILIALALSRSSAGWRRCCSSARCGPSRTGPLGAPRAPLEPPGAGGRRWGPGSGGCRPRSRSATAPTTPRSRSA